MFPEIVQSGLNRSLATLFCIALRNGVELPSCLSIALLRVPSRKCAELSSCPSVGPLYLPSGNNAEVIPLKVPPWS